MLARFRILQHLHHAKGTTMVLLRARETWGLRNCSFSLQRRLERKVEFDFNRRLEDGEDQVQHRFRRSKIPNWCALVVGGLVALGIYEGINKLKLKGRHEKIKDNALSYEMKIERNAIARMEVFLFLRELETYVIYIHKIETSSQKHYWLLLQKVKVKYEETLRLQVKTLRELKKLRQQVCTCKDDDKKTMQDLLEKWITVSKKYEAQLVAISKTLEKEMKYDNGAQIVSWQDLLKVLSDELFLKLPPPPKVKDSIENDQVTRNANKKL